MSIGAKNLRPTLRVSCAVLCAGCRARGTPRLSMLEVSEPGKYHRHIVGIAIPDRVLVLDRSTGLNDCLDTVVVCNLDAVGEGEESVRSHHRIFVAEAKRAAL